MKRTARHKLNAAAINGVMIISAVVAMLFQSWLAFVLVAAALLLTAICAGDVRINSDRGDHNQ